MSSKDSYWFRHDSTAGRAIKMRKMAHIYGHWGKGVYWDVIEILRDQSGYKFECNNFGLQMLCDLIGCKDFEKFINWFSDCVKYELLKLDSKKVYFTSPALNKNMVKWETSKENGSKGGRPVKKPKQNPTETQIKPNEEPNENHNITVQYSIEDNSIKEKKIIKRFDETNFENTCRTLNTSKEKIKERLLEFLEIEKLTPTFKNKPEGEVLKHFRNWLNYNLPKVTIKKNTTAPWANQS